MQRYLSAHRYPYRKPPLAREVARHYAVTEDSLHRAVLYFRGIIRKIGANKSSVTPHSGATAPLRKEPLKREIKMHRFTQPTPGISGCKYYLRFTCAVCRETAGGFFHDKCKQKERAAEVLQTGIRGTARGADRAADLYHRRSAHRSADHHL